MEGTGIMNFRKSTYSSTGGASCIEVGSGPSAVLVRDTKQEGRPDRTVVEFTPRAWTRFTASLR